MKVCEDEFTLAFMDIAKDVDGQILVIPKEHCENILDCTYDVLSKTMDIVKKVSNHLTDECGYDVESMHKKVMMLKMVRPTLEMKKDALEFKQEFFDNGETVINGSEMLDNMDSYEEWLTSITDNQSVDTVNPNWVVTDTFFTVDGNNRIVGIIDLRHTLNDFLKDFGNSGYSVRPSERRKGYATKMLAMIKDIAKEAGMTKLQLSVERDNEPSLKTIVKNGGVYQRSFEFQGELADVYMVDL